MADQINFIFKFPDNYNPVYVNGAYGGVTAKNEIVVNFFLERMPLPKEIVMEISEDGTIHETVTAPENHQKNIVRFVSTGIVMSLDSAISIRDWLNGHIDKLQKRFE